MAKTVQRDLAFTRDAPIIEALLSSNLKSSSSNLKSSHDLCPLDTASQDTDFESDSGNDHLPPYTTHDFDIELGLPQPPVLVLGRPAIIQPILHTSPRLLQEGDVYIRSVVARLRTTAVAGVGRNRECISYFHHGWSVHGLVRVDAEQVTLNSDGWGSSFTIDSPPTVRSDILNVTHSLEVTIGVSRGLGTSATEVRYKPRPVSLLQELTQCFLHVVCSDTG